MQVDRIILSGSAVVNSAYEAYLALAQNQSNVEKKTKSPSKQTLVYLPRKKVKKGMPKKKSNLKTLKGTQQFHKVSLSSPRSDSLVCENLSCSCSICLRVQMGPCYFSQFRDSPSVLNMLSKKRRKSLPLRDVQTDARILFNHIVQTIKFKLNQYFKSLYVCMYTFIKKKNI